MLTTEPTDSPRALASAILVNIGLLTIVVATAMPLLRISSSHTTPYIYSAGALMLIVGRFMTSRKTDDIRLSRLYRLETWSALIFAVAAFFMFYPAAGATDWIAFTMAGGFVQAYASIMIQRRLAKNRK